ncbi:MAG TPA: hypothetical protein PLY59_07745 [Clostridiales bacterium]|nr:hypothetical protein [Clostridiales bacterium]
MTIVQIIDKITAWADANICKQIKLKLPDDNAADSSFDYTETNPAAFALFVPTKEKLPPSVAAPIPSLCVQFTEGTDRLTENKGTLKVRMSLSAWNPGTHGPELFHANGNGSYTRYNTPEARALFTRHGEGWRDVWNFVDAALLALESTEYIDGLRIVKEDGISFGPFMEQDAISDWYPYWFAWITFTVERGLARAPEYHQYL